MDGRGRCLDNVFVERLWRTVKYEDVYVNGYTLVPELQRGLGRYFPFYNHERLHQSLDYRTPAEVYGLSRRSEQERHSFSPRKPSARVKGLRGEKECPETRAERRNEKCS